MAGSALFKIVSVFALAGTLAACSGSSEDRGERVRDIAREDVREFRDYLYNSGISVNTRLPDR